MNELTISLSAIAANYNRLNFRANCAAVVKANGYGLGVLPIAERLKKEGCKKFFVAHLEEGIELRKVIKTEEIFVFHGAQKGEVKEFAKYKLTPVLNNPSQLQNWPKDKQAAAHFDTGMTRLGFAAEDASKLKGYNITLVMSHLTSADEANDKMSVKQLEAFKKIAAQFPKAKKSLANSAGILLGKPYYFDLARPGIGLYKTNAVALTAPIIQINEIIKPTPIGYGGSHIAKKGDVVATIPIGYADGFLRTLGNQGKVYIGGHELPVLGRVSMDLITIGLNNLPVRKRTIGQMVEILGKNYTVSDMAKDAGTIEYEIITRLGNRFKRVYK